MAHAPQYVSDEFASGALQPIKAGKTGAPEVLSAAGAISLDKEHTQLTITGVPDVAFTLAAGDETQRKTVHLKSKGGAGNAVITPAGGFTNAGSAATTITLDTVDDFVTLQFLGGKWRVLTALATIA